MRPSGVLAGLGRLGLGADMRDESAWGAGQARVRGEEVGGVSVAARTRARVPQHSERGRARGRPSGDEAPAEEMVTLGKQVRRCVQVERGVTVADTLK